MESYWPENLPTYRKRAIEKLTRGQEFAIQLQSMLTKPLKADGSMYPEDLVIKILGSFTDTLSILKSTDSDEVSQFPAGWGCRKYEDSGESSKTSALKDRRGCYKRRKTALTTTKVTPTLIDDGFAWRKYGQKAIHNTNHPRNYFRCTHKFDQECLATKQVQRTEDDPPMYRTTYHGRHTCRNLLKSPQIILDPTATDSSVLLSFGPTHKPDDPFFAVIKQECKEGNNNVPSLAQSPPPNYLMSPDLTTFESYGPMLSSVSDHGGDVISSGVYSCTTSTRSFEMDNMMLGSGDFDDLPFDFVD